MPPYCSRATEGPRTHQGASATNSATQKATAWPTPRLASGPPRSPRRTSRHTVARRARGRSGPAPPRAHAREERRADQEAGGVDGEGRARADAEHERRGQRRADELGDVVEHRRDGVGFLDLRLRHGLRQEPAGGGTEERLGGAEQHLDHHELPDPELAGDDQDGEQRVQARSARGRSRSSPDGAAGGPPTRRRSAGSRPAARRARPAPGRGRSRCP